MMMKPANNAYGEYVYYSDDDYADDEKKNYCYGELIFELASRL